MTQPPPIEVPDAFTCPYRKACWQREAVRILVTIGVTLLTILCTRCTVKVGTTSVRIANPDEMRLQVLGQTLEWRDHPTSRPYQTAP
jgi:hypothetical protein